MAKNVSHVWSTIQVGRRFVYYNSLLQDDPALAKKAQAELNKNLNNLTIQQDKKNSISEVLSFLEKSIAFELQNEKDFFKQRIRDNPIIKKYPEFHKKLKGCLRKDFDYITFISALNLALSGVNFYKRNLEHEKQRLENLNKNYQSLYEKEGKSNIQTLYLTNMDKLKKEYGQRILKDVQSTLVRIQAQIFNEAIREVIDSPVYRDKIISLIQKNGYVFSSSTSVSEQIKNLLAEPIIKQIISKLSSSRDILANLDNIYEKHRNDAFSSLQIGNAIKKESSIENSTTYEVVRKSLSTPQKNQTEILALAECLVGKQTAFSPVDELQKIIETIDKTYAPGDQFTLFGNTYVAKDNQTVQQLNKNGKLGRPKSLAAVLNAYKGEISKRIKKDINISKIYEALKANIELISFKISGPDFAEITGALTTHIKTKGLVDGSANLKNDFFLTVDPTGLLKKNMLSRTFAASFSENLINELNQTEKLMRAQKGIGVATDLALSDKAFQHTIITQIAETRKKLELAGLEAQRIEAEMNDLLKNCFIIQGSVKDYEMYNNDIGFIGGSLGSGGHIEALENLYQMYEMGGITPIDKDWMYFAIVNSSSASLGSHLKNPIQKYLSLAAALTMFNYGSSEIQQIANFSKRKLSNDSPRFLNLYYVNGFYFPSSFILTLVLENLTDCFTIIKEKADEKRTGVKIFNKSNPSWIDKNTDPFDTAWFDIAHKTWDNTQIQFTFLAGLLDIIEQLETAAAAIKL